MFYNNIEYYFVTMALLFDVGCNVFFETKKSSEQCNKNHIAQKGPSSFMKKTDSLWITTPFRTIIIGFTRFSGVFLYFWLLLTYLFSLIQIFTVQSMNFYCFLGFNDNHVSHQIINQLPLLLAPPSACWWLIPSTDCSSIIPPRQPSLFHHHHYHLCQFVFIASPYLWVDRFCCRCPTHVRAIISCVVHIYTYLLNGGQFFEGN